jgi:hypothetical protein
MGLTVGQIANIEQVACEIQAEWKASGINKDDPNAGLLALAVLDEVAVFIAESRIHDPEVFQDALRTCMVTLGVALGGVLVENTF